MKKIPIIALCTAALLALAPATAQAGSKERALIGGFLGGLIVGLTTNQPDCPPVYETVARPGPAHRHGSSGYWQENRVRVWVPGHWAVRIDRCGTRVRHYVAGHHEWRTERIWVATAHPRHSHRHAYRY